MKKQLIISSIIGLIILAGFFTTITINSTNAETASSKNLATLSTSDEAALPAPSPELIPENETVYVITDHAGSVNKKFIGNTLNTSATPLPLDLNISYFLDGHEIKAEELIGKSGHIRIVYKYTSTKTYQNSLIPFLAITGLTLDSTNFNNIKIENGKIISENGKIIIAGYSLVGLGENLGTDLLPNHFAIEADTNNFKLSDSYTIATNEVIADLDTSKFTSIDSLINSVNELSTGFDKILAGTTSLNNGLSELSAGLVTLKSNIDKITDKVFIITSKADEIINKFNDLLSSSQNIIATIPSTPENTISEINNLATEYDLDPELTAKITEIVNNNYSETYDTFMNYTNKINSYLSNGSVTVSEYNQKVKTGATELRNGVTALSNGANQLYSGSTELKNGLLTFKSRGIDQLANFANHDLDSFVRNLRKSVEAASSYRSYATPNTKSTKFIFKTPSLK